MTSCCRRNRSASAPRYVVFGGGGGTGVVTPFESSASSSAASLPWMAATIPVGDRGKVGSGNGADDGIGTRCQPHSCTGGGPTARGRHWLRSARSYLWRVRPAADLRCRHRGLRQARLPTRRRRNRWCRSGRRSRPVRFSAGVSGAGFSTGGFSAAAARRLADGSSEPGDEPLRRSRRLR